jgi:hypothetical protein
VSDAIRDQIAACAQQCERWLILAARHDPCRYTTPLQRELFHGMARAHAECYAAEAFRLARTAQQVAA